MVWSEDIFSSDKLHACYVGGGHNDDVPNIPYAASCGEEAPSDAVSGIPARETTWYKCDMASQRNPEAQTMPNKK